MEFSIMLDLGRRSPELSFEENLEQITELVKAAEEVGFSGVFVGEHHGHEMTIAPAPFTLLTHLASVTERVKLGTAVLCAPYWHPIRLAGEAALFDHISGGRLELGIGRGAYPYEFARMAGGIPPEIAREQLAELLPALNGLWKGDYAHEGSLYSFPETTSTPRPRGGEPLPLWVSARHPDVFDIAIKNRANLMVAPLSAGIEEVESLRERLNDAVDRGNADYTPKLMVLRDTYVASSESDVDTAIDALLYGEGFFSNLFRTDGDVKDGWVKWIDPESVETQKDDFKRDQIRENQMFGTAEEVRERLKEYEKLGTDVYLYNASWGLSFEDELASVRRFGAEVIAKYEGASK
ncbi:LLM class flavin-dependent oxidoreductase [Leucobacter luti]|uniref:LLM class flavin-dependent oxidoreductase n=1 Tax=Leucobacter luti TaxID=340320 RepID=UPI003D028993